jgi:RHS repeat-associated protein
MPPATLTAENTNRKHEWDWGGRMRSFRDQVSGSQATVFAHYTYDSGGQRTQKVVCKDNDDPVHTVYIGGIYEHHEKISSGSVTAENNFLHIMDDSKRVAIKRIGAHLDGSNPASIQYHLGDHLQSSSVVLDGAGNFFNREEYRPYGETSFGSYDKKRYRFTGQERDEESGLNYHGARYYAPWAAKWHSPDPKGMVDGPNLYSYARSNPINLSDPDGTPCVIA